MLLASPHQLCCKYTYLTCRTRRLLHALTYSVPFDVLGTHVRKVISFRGCTFVGGIKQDQPATHLLPRFCSLALVHSNGFRRQSSTA